MTQLQQGAKAPDIRLPGAWPGGEEKEVALSALLGSWVVIYIYPKDSTSG